MSTNQKDTEDYDLLKSIEEAKERLDKRLQELSSDSTDDYLAFYEQLLLEE